MNQKSAIYSLSIASLLSFTASTNDPTTKLNYALKHLDSKEAKTQLIAEFPRDAKAFKEFCQERRTVLKDCSGLFENGVQKLIPKSEYAEPLAEILAGLVTEVKYGADAPNYLQRAWLTLCQGQPKAFVAAVENLPSAKQEKSLKYMSAYLHKPNDNKVLPCIEALEQDGEKEISARLKKYLKGH